MLIKQRLSRRRNLLIVFSIKVKLLFCCHNDPEITSFALEKAKIFLKKTLDGSGISSILSLQDLI